MNKQLIILVATKLEETNGWWNKNGASLEGESTLTEDQKDLIDRLWKLGHPGCRDNVPMQIWWKGDWLLFPQCRIDGMSYIPDKNLLSFRFTSLRRGKKLEEKTAAENAIFEQKKKICEELGLSVDEEGTTLYTTVDEVFAKILNTSPEKQEKVRELMNVYRNLENMALQHALVRMQERQKENEKKPVDAQS